MCIIIQEHNYYNYIMWILLSIVIYMYKHVIISTAVIRMVWHM